VATAWRATAAQRGGTGSAPPHPPGHPLCAGGRAHCMADAAAARVCSAATVYTMAETGHYGGRQVKDQTGRGRSRAVRRPAGLPAARSTGSGRAGGHGPCRCSFPHQPARRHTRCARRSSATSGASARCSRATVSRSYSRSSTKRCCWTAPASGRADRNWRRSSALRWTVSPITVTSSKPATKAGGSRPEAPRPRRAKPPFWVGQFWMPIDNFVTRQPLVHLLT